MPCAHPVHALPCSQLDYMMATVANEEFRDLYSLEPDEDDEMATIATYSRLKARMRDV